MTKDRWIQSALTHDELVADLLLRLKQQQQQQQQQQQHSSDLYSDSLLIKKTVTTNIIPPCWGIKKTRSKSTAAVKEQRGSPTTHLSWNGGGSSSDCSRPSDLSSGCRSLKGKEGPSVSSYNNLDQNHRNKMKKTELCSEKAETEGPRRGFVLPDLNMTPNEDDMSMMVI